MFPLRAPLVVLLAFLSIAPAAQAWDASVPPVKVDGNPTCEDFGLTSITKFDPVNSGNKSGITLTKHDTYYVKWSSTVAVDWVIVKGGPNANVYKYATDAFGDDWLHAPINPSTGKPYGLSHVEFCTDGHSEPGPEPHPAISIEKTGVAFAYAGDTVTYELAVTNTGDTKLTNVVVTDPKCMSAPVRTDSSDTSFDPGDTWEYTCESVVPAGVTQVDNTAQACGKDAHGERVCDVDDHSFPVRTIAIQVDKAAVETTAVAGSKVHFTISVKNTGNTSFVGYTIDDANCAEQRTGANAADPVLDPGETWTYSCEMATQVGQTSAHNTVTATGTNSDGKSATDDGAASIPLTQPQQPGGKTPPPAGGQTPPPAAGGGVLPESVVSGRARLRGPSGCVRRAFRARVSGRSIRSVAFYLDGRLLKKFGKRARYSIKIRPGGLGVGRHRVVARVRFVRRSGTRPRTLRLTFRRCARQTVTPRFTG